MRADNAIPFAMLSDPDLVMAERYGVATSSGHPMARKYPRGAFLQPAYLVFCAGASADPEIVHSWMQSPGLLNMYGALGRPSPEQMLDEAMAALA